MKKILLFLLLSLNSLLAQTTTNELTAEGSAKTLIRPDLAVLHVTVIKEDEVEKTALKELNEEMQKLQKYLNKLGFSKDNISISDYTINRNDFEDKEKYTATGSLEVNFEVDYKLLDAFYQEIQAGNFKDADVNFEAAISTDLEKATRTKLVQLAIEDAKVNAEIMAKAVNVKLNNVKSVSKYNMQLDYIRQRNRSRLKASAPVLASGGPATPFHSFEAEEREIEETITIVYEISKQ